MRRDVFLTAATRIIEDFSKTGLNEAIESLFEMHRKDSKETKISIIPVLHQYAMKIANYSNAELDILRAFGLEKLSNPKYWQDLIGENNDPGEMYSVRGTLIGIQRYVPIIIDLLRQERLHAVRTASQDAPDFLKGKDIITVILPETDTQYSSPARLTYALDAIQLFYTVFATIENLPENDLTVIACDSGSDKSFDFTGLPQVIQGVRETILSIWDRIVLRQHQHTRASIETIAQGLPVIEKISVMESNGSLQPEMAEQLRRKTIAACTKFIDAGAITPELETQPLYSPRALMSPEVKLLAAPLGPKHVDDLGSEGKNSTGGNYKKRPVRNENEEEDLRSMLKDLQRQLDEQKQSSSSRPKSRRILPKT